MPLIHGVIFFFYCLSLHEKQSTGKRKRKKKKGCKWSTGSEISKKEGEVIKEEEEKNPFLEEAGSCCALICSYLFLNSFQCWLYPRFLLAACIGHRHLPPPPASPAACPLLCYPSQCGRQGFSPLFLALSAQRPDRRKREEGRAGQGRAGEKSACSPQLLIRMPLHIISEIHTLITVPLLPSLEGVGK